jgi:hypothetical protein
MEIKIGDKVRFSKSNQGPGPYRGMMRFGTVVDIKYSDDKYETFYSVLDDRDNATISMGWSCNIFPHLGEIIELDITRMRDDKLKEIIDRRERE